MIPTTSSASALMSCWRLFWNPPRAPTGLTIHQWNAAMATARLWNAMDRANLFRSIVLVMLVSILVSLAINVIMQQGAFPWTEHVPGIVLIACLLGCPVAFYVFQAFWRDALHANPVEATMVYGGRLTEGYSGDIFEDAHAMIVAKRYWHFPGWRRPFAPPRGIPR